MVLNGDALNAAAACADDIFDTPAPRHIEQARRFVTAYLVALGIPVSTEVTPGLPEPLAVQREKD